MNPDQLPLESDIWDAGYKAALSDLDLPMIREALTSGWIDIHELRRLAIHNLTADVPALAHHEGIARSEVVINRLKAAACKVRMVEEGITERDIAETNPEKQ